MALLEPSPTTPMASTSDVTMSVSASRVPARLVGRAIQEIDDGRHGKSYIFGAFKPAGGEKLTAPYKRCITADYIDFLEQVEAWITPDIERIYAIMDHLRVHRTPAGICLPVEECALSEAY